MSLGEEICVLCCQEVKFYATGSCDHPVCYVCSTRMRVLCKQNECPICRNDMPLVIFTHKKIIYGAAPKFKHQNEKYSLAFEDEEIFEAFKNLLLHVCPTCGSEYATFNDLKNHVRRDHALFYCELCVENLKIFTFERRCYNRKDFAHHKRVGDIDNTSHRGHPLCEFCDERFIDLDELYRHSRRDHFFCHFCDADGMHKTQFYPEYTSLKVHFRRCHYLCEEGDCDREQFIGAFRTEIDLKAHKALSHSKNKTKAEVKQARTLDLQFPITPRNASSGNSSPNYNDYRHNRHNTRRENEDARSDSIEESQSSKQSQTKTFNTQCVQDFPLLANGSAARMEEPFRESSEYANRISNDVNIMRKQARTSQQSVQNEDFPSLSSAVAGDRLSRNNGAILHNSSTPATRSSAQVVAQGSHKMKNWGKSFKENKNEKNASQSTARASVKSNLSSEEDFPKLETKKGFTYNAKTQPLGEWQRPEPVSVQSKDTTAQQIYQKCKSKKKQKNVTSNNQPVPNFQHVTVNQHTEPIPLAKIYSGFNNCDVMGIVDKEKADRHLDLKISDKIEKYRMAMDADDVPWREKVHLVPDDFPPLAPPPAVARVQCPPGFQPSGSSCAPPGFSEKLKNKPKKKSCVSLSSIAQQLTDPVPCQYSYNHPSDFQKRNGLLIQQIYQFVDSDNKLFDEFKSLSGDFRKSRISAADYYLSCMRLLGEERFLQLFAELLCLLPDIKKQQELLTVHKSLKQDREGKGSVHKHKESEIDSISLLNVCKICNQVLVKQDYNIHTGLHEIEVNQ